LALQQNCINHSSRTLERRVDETDISFSLTESYEVAA
jgi:hypothetical protein